MAKEKFADFKNSIPNWIKNESKFELYKIRHTAEHVFNQAVLELWPDKVTRALAHLDKKGFSNDAHWDTKLSEDDFENIEQKMQEIIERDLPLVREEISEAEARELFAGNKFKQEWIDQFAADGGPITIYRTGDQFVDLCKGPHVDSTGEIKAIKLLSIAGAYWKADENNEMLTRVYGTAFASQQELDKHLEQLDKAKENDHRRLAKELDLIVWSELVGSGLPMYTPRGSILRNAVYNYSRELNEQIGYQEVNTPNFNRAELFKISGHYDKYKEDMFQVVSKYSKEEMYFKPMNCPQHTQLYASQMRSYRDLPIRYADFSNLARDEKPGEIHGILRSRIFTQDDGHAFVREDQIADEFVNVMGVIKQALETYGLEHWVRLSLRDPEKKEKYLGEDQVWDEAESKLREIVANQNIEYVEALGEAAIYGPKMDFMAKDSLGREWQISTIQIDMNIPARFKLKYIDEEGEERMPIMIHRAIVGSERFIGIIIEHFGGAFPAWLAPEQVRIIPIKDENIEYANKVAATLKAAGIRNQIDAKSDRMQNKIRKAQELKVPFMLIMGGQEAESNTVSVRLRNGKEYKGMDLDEFVNLASKNIQEKNLEISLM